MREVKFSIKNLCCWYQSVSSNMIGTPAHDMVIFVAILALVSGNICCNICGNIFDNICGNICGDICGNICVGEWKPLSPIHPLISPTSVWNKAQRHSSRCGTEEPIVERSCKPKFLQLLQPFEHFCTPAAHLVWLKPHMGFRDANIHALYLGLVYLH